MYYLLMISLSLALGVAPALAADEPATLVSTPELVQSFTEVTNKSFDVPGKISSIHFDATADCETFLTLRKLVVQTTDTEKTKAAVKIDITCQRISADATAAKIFSGKLDVSEKFVVTTGDHDLNFSIEIPVEIDALTKGAVTQASILSALKTHPVKPGTGLNLETPFIKGLESNSPTIKIDVVANLTKMAYDDRLEMISNRIVQLLESAVSPASETATPAPASTN